MTEGPSLTYRDAGVDIDAGDELVERIKPHVARTARPEVLAGVGGFGAMIEIPPGRWQRPVLVAGTDGVGTKLKLAFATGRHDTVGIDLVAMSVNDVLVNGASVGPVTSYAFAPVHADQTIAAFDEVMLARPTSEAVVLIRMQSQYERAASQAYRDSRRGMSRWDRLRCWWRWVGASGGILAT